MKRSSLFRFGARYGVSLRWRLIAVVAVAGVLASVFTGYSVFADTQPNLGGSTPMYYSIARSDYTLAKTNVVGIYFPTNVATANVTIDPLVQSGGTDFRFTATLSAPGARVAPMVVPSSAANANNINMYIDIRNAPVDSSTGLKKVELAVVQTSTTAEGYYRFSLTAPDGGLVRPLAEDVTSYETVSGTARRNDFQNYALTFGSDCSIVSPTWKTIQLIDPDNYVSGNWWGDRSAQGYRNTDGTYRGETFSVHVQRATVGSSNFANMPSVDYHIPANSYVTSNNVSGRGYRIWPMGGETTVGRERASQFQILMRANEIYRLVVTNLKTNNSIQVQLPTDSIYYDTGCRQWSMDHESRARQVSSSAAISGEWDRRYTAGTDAISASPGQRVDFMHKLTNVGRATMGKDGLSAYLQTYTTTSPKVNESGASRWTEWRPGEWRPTGTVLTKNNRDIMTSGTDRDYYYWADYGGTNQSAMSVVVANDMYNASNPNYLCQRIATQKSASDTRWRFSAPACVRIMAPVYDYNLTPRIESSVTQLEEGQPTVNDLRASIGKTGTTSSRAANYGVARFVVRGNSTTTIAGSSDSEGVTISRDDRQPSGLTNDWLCRVVEVIKQRNPSITIDTSSCAGQELAQVARTVISGSSTSVALSSDRYPNDISGLGLRMGDRVCYVSVVSAYSDDYDYDHFKYSAPHCIAVAKSPKVQFLGADIKTSGNVLTSMSNIGGRMYGSWAEYAIMSSHGDVVSASGASLSTRSDGRDANLSSLSRNALTFANVGLPGSTFGSLGGEPPRSDTPPSYTDNTGSDLPSGDVDLNNIPSGTYRSTANLTISGEVAAGKRLVIKSTGRVTIDDNITYADTDPYTDAGNLPQLVISARDIVINDGVSEVNAWLIATNGVSTCGSLPSGGWTTGLNSGVCNVQLKVNGPIIAEHLYLRRTFGSENASGMNRGTPAEILNLRPDVYLRNQADASESSSIGIQTVRELPPRF